MIDKLVDVKQASFIPGRLASDNMVIAQELIHTMQKKTSRKGMMAMKVDLEKAYDCIQWSFFEEVVRTMGFGEKIHVTRNVLY